MHPTSRRHSRLSPGYYTAVIQQALQPATHGRSPPCLQAALQDCSEINRVIDERFSKTEPNYNEHRNHGVNRNHLHMLLNSTSNTSLQSNLFTQLLECCTTSLGCAKHSCTPACGTTQQPEHEMTTTTTITTTTTKELDYISFGCQTTRN